LKILLVHKYFHLNGGADVFFQKVGSILEENGHEVAYFSTKSDKNLESKFSDYFVTAPNFQSQNPIKKVTSLVKICYSFEAKRKFEQLVKDFNPDIVHLFGFFTHISVSILNVTKNYNIPTVLTCNDYKHICPNYQLFNNNKICEDCRGERFYSALLNKCAKNSYSYSFASMIEAYFNKISNSIPNKIDLFLFASEFMYQKTKAFWKNYDFSSKIIRNPYDIREFSNIYYDNFILFIGRFVPEKGIDVLLTAMKYIPSIKLKIVGSGPMKEMLYSIKKSLNLRNVEFLGELWGAELDHLLSTCRFSVVPSKWHENYPYVILHSFEYSKAVIGSNRGGIPELINNETGIIYDADSPADLAEKIKYLFYNKDMYLKLGSNSNKFLRINFSSTKFYTELITAYSEVMS